MVRQKNEARESVFSKLYTFSKSIELLLRNRGPNMTQNKHVNAIYGRPDVAGDVVSGWYVFW